MIYVITSTTAEQDSVRDAVGRHQEEVISVAKLAKSAGLSVSRTRIALGDLIELGTVAKIEAIKMNPSYRRYYYRLQK